VARLATRFLRSGNPKAGGIEVCEGLPGADALEPLMNGWRGRKRRCGLEPSQEWYAWRFHPESEAQYEWLVAYRGGDVRAAIAWSRVSGMIAEFLGDDAEALQAAVASALRRAAGPIGTLRAFTNEPAAAAALHACGFVRRTKVPLIVRSMTARNLGANIHDHDSWSVTGNDLDNF
jgi:hypothetical protein